MRRAFNLPCVRRGAKKSTPSLRFASIAKEASSNAWERVSKMQEEAVLAYLHVVARYGIVYYRCRHASYVYVNVHRPTLEVHVHT